MKILKDLKEKLHAKGVDIIDTDYYDIIDMWQSWYNGNHIMRSVRFCTGNLLEVMDCEHTAEDRSLCLRDAPQKTECHADRGNCVRPDHSCGRISFNFACRVPNRRFLRLPSGTFYRHIRHLCDWTCAV